MIEALVVQKLLDNCVCCDLCSLRSKIAEGKRVNWGNDPEGGTSCLLNGYPETTK
jgi:hypothetical protein